MLLLLSRASQNNKMPDVPRPITTQANNSTALPAANEKSNINSLTFNSSTSSISSSSREANAIVEDLSSLTMLSNSETNVTPAITSSASSNSDFTGTDTRRTGKCSDTTLVCKGPSDDDNKGVSDSVVLERHESDDSNILTAKCQQQQNRSKENAVSNKGHHQQSKSAGKKKSKDKKNTNVSHEKLKQSGGGGARNVSVVSVVSDSTAANSEGRPLKENVTKTGASHSNTRDAHNKKKKNKGNVAPTAGADSHEVLSLAKSESSFFVEQRSSSTGVKAPPPGLTKQPSHTNAVNGESMDYYISE